MSRQGANRTRPCRSRYRWFAALEVQGGVAVTGTRIKRVPNPLSGRVLDNDAAPGGAMLTVELVDGPAQPQRHICVRARGKL